MKEFIAESGGRYTYVDDLLNLQEMTLALSTLFEECADFILSGCRIQGTAITPGYVWLGGKVRRFEGCADASFPYYIYEKNSHESVVYANEANKRGRTCYLALGGGSVPTSADPVTGTLPRYIEIREDYAPHLIDKFFGRYAVMADSPFPRQTVHKDLELTGTLAVDKGIESRYALLVAPAAGSCVLRGHFPEAGVAALEAGTKSSVQASLRLNAQNGEVTLRSRGVDAAVFYEEGCKLFTLTATTARIHSLCLFENQLINRSDSSSDAAVRVNYVGYLGGTTAFRNFEVYDGKKRSVPLLRIEGKSASVQVHARLEVEAAEGFCFTGAERCGALYWADGSGEYTAALGYLSTGSANLQVENARGEIVLTPKGYVDIAGELRVRGVPIAATYATQQALAAGLAGKVDAVEGKGLSACDFTPERCRKLDAIAGGAFAEDGTAQSDGYVTCSQVAAELRKKADRLLGGLGAAEQKSAAGNLGVYTRTESDGRYGRLASLFGDFVDYLVQQGRSSEAAQELLREKLGAAGSRELAEGYLRREGCLTDLLLADEEDRRRACRTLGAAYGADCQPRLTDTGWLQMANSGTGTDTSKFFVRQIGSVVCIQGRINTARRDGSNDGGIVAVIPNAVQPPKYGLRTTMAHWNDDHKYNRGSSFTIDAGSRYVRIYERGMYDSEINLNFSYMV